MDQYQIQINTGPVWVKASSAEHAIEVFRNSDNPRAHWEILSVNARSREHENGTASNCPQAIRDAIAEVARKANLERCAIDKAVQDEMRIYTNTWIYEPLLAILAWCDGDQTAASVKRDILGY